MLERQYSTSALGAFLKDSGPHRLVDSSAGSWQVQSGSLAIEVWPQDFQFRFQTVEPTKVVPKEQRK